VIEYYHAGLDHYFVTRDANEIKALDSGGFAGWVRTGQTFQVFNNGDARLANSVRVCRFYGNPARGLDSHFYTATPKECEEVQQKFPDDWLLESPDVFRVHALNAAGACPANTKAVYRLYNGRADVNHRYTTDPAIVDTMLAKGYTMEGAGSGPVPVVFCAANISPAQPASGAPLCTVTPSTQYPLLGGSLTLAAECTGSPTVYAWINCSGSGATCTVTSDTAGPVLYGVVATNGSGAGRPATLTLNWQPAAGAAPMCDLAASNRAPELDTPLVLTANCHTEPVAKYEWLSCSALVPDACAPIADCANATTTCAPVGKQQGDVLYALRASNNAGSSKPSVLVTWRPSSGPAPGPSPNATPVCVLAPSSNTPAINSTLVLTASCTNAPTAYEWSGCLSLTNVCNTTSATVGSRTYTLTARNASGVGPAATVTVNWQVPPTSAPVCTLSADPPDPYAGSTTKLTANCTQSPSSYAWTNCTATLGNTCTAANPQTGPVTYSVRATNTLGTSAPASLTVDWREPPPIGADFCGSFSKVRRMDLNWGGFVNTNSTQLGVPGFEGDGVFVGRIRVPANASGTSIPGLVSIVEFINGQAQRHVTLSPSACDFRGFTAGQLPPPTDPTGATRPLAWSFGINPSLSFVLQGMPGQPKLTPGETYYVNIRNRTMQNTPSCATAECNVRITVNAPH
jgi:hypothetical protein